MLGKTHVLIGSVALLALAPPSSPLIMAVTLGSLAPDLDSPHSLITTLPIIGRWLFKPTALVVSTVVRHRTGTHSLLLVLALSLAAYFLQSKIPISPALSGAFLLGLLSHILADCLTISGVPLLWPLRKHDYHLTPKLLRLRTSSFVESGLSTLLLLAVFRLLWR